MELAEVGKAMRSAVGLCTDIAGVAKSKSMSSRDDASVMRGDASAMHSMQTLLMPIFELPACGARYQNDLKATLSPVGANPLWRLFLLYS